MRHNVLQKHSTKPERIFYEVLKELHVPFKHRWLIHGLEVDFLLWDTVVVEIDGHEQNPAKNELLASLGFTPVHFNNSEVSRNSITSFIIKLNGSYKLP